GTSSCSLDPASVEMLLLLRASFDLIPKDIPRLSSQKEVEEAVPERFRDAARLEEVHALDPWFFGRGEETDVEAQEEEVL
ncbi:unnamed protein product, partial [Laminaria digitata]